MIILLCLDFLGILVSFLAHLCLLLGFSLPSGKIVLPLNIGIVVVVVARLVITKGLRQGNDLFYDKSLKGVGPLWLKVVIGLVISYGIVNCIFSLSGMFSRLSVGMSEEDYTIALRKLYIGIFSLSMACYAVEFLLLCLYKILKDRKLRTFQQQTQILKEEEKIVN